MENAFSKTARYYDKLYSKKDYAGEVQKLISYLGTDNSEMRRSLLDVACGTGLHIEHLRKHFVVEGLDISPDLLELAKKRNPGVRFYLADMINFNISKQFDIVTCLFSSIGYMKTLENLRAAVMCMVEHLKPGGTLVVEPWFTPGSWHPNTVHGVYVDEPELKIARINTSFEKDSISIFDLHHLIGTPDGTEHIVEHHELGLFEVEEMVAVFKEAGLLVNYDPDGLTGRGLYIGKRS